MAMAKLDIWISAMDDPCGIDDTHNWYVTIFDCDGNVLKWCGKTYIVMPTTCGHLEVEVPPGTYYIKAVWHFTVINAVYYVNHFTDAAIVQACCNETVCVKLFNPSVHRCGKIVVKAIDDLVRQKAIDPELARQQAALMNKILDNVPKPVKGFELNYPDEIQ